jgi:hypothetical protein
MKTIISILAVFVNTTITNIAFIGTLRMEGAHPFVILILGSLATSWFALLTAQDASPRQRENNPHQ